MHHLICTLPLSLLLLSACAENRRNPAPKQGACSTSTAATKLVATPPMWTDVAPLIQQKCATVGCHANGSTLTALNSYAAVASASAAVMNRATIRGDMPPGRPLSATEVRLLTDWQANGFAEAGSAQTTPTRASATPSPTPSSAAPKAATNAQPAWDNIKPLLASCATVNCHGAGSVVRADFTVYEKVKAKISEINTRLDLEANDPRAMPPAATSGGIKTPLDVRKRLAAWELLGAPKTATSASTNNTANSGGVIIPTPTPGCT